MTLDRVGIVPLLQSDSEVRFQIPRHDNGYALLQVGSAATEFFYFPPPLQDLPPGAITTIAGVGKFLRLEQPATQTMIDQAGGVALAANGDIYITQVGRGLVLRIRTDGILQHVAGRLGPVDFNHVGDEGPARDAFIGFARDVAVDAAGNLYVVDTRARVRRIDAATGIITTIAGTGVAGFSGDHGPATQAQLIDPTHITCSPDGTLYFLDANVRVRKVTPDGTITTVAGNGTVGPGGDNGPSTDAQLNSFDRDHGDIAVDSDGNVFILETEGRRVRRVDARTGIITTFASQDPRGPFLRPRSLAVDGNGNVYVATTSNIDKFDRSGQLIEQWFNGGGFSEDGALAKQAQLGSVHALAVAPNGDILYADLSGRRIRKVNLATGKIETLAGMTPNVIGVPGPAVGAVFASPSGDLAFLPSGDLLFVAGEDNRMYRIDPRTGMISVFAGTGMFIGGYEEAPALATSLSAALAIDTDSHGNVYFADKQTIRTIDQAGIVHRVAGRPGEFGLSGDAGPAKDATLCQPEDVALDRDGNFYIADANNNRIRRVDRVSGIITTIAGTGPSNGFEGYGRGSSCGDGGPAGNACLNTPIAVAIRDDGTIYVNDFYSEPKIRKIAPDGTISSVKNLLQATKLIVGPGESIFANGGAWMYRVDHDRMRLIVGDGVAGFTGDGGPAILARTAQGESELAAGLAIDAEGNLFFYDAGNRRIRAIRFGAVLAPPGATIEATRIGTTVSVTVFDSLRIPAPGVRVDFSAPASGASCSLSSPFAVTDANGNATVNCVPNCLTGNYSVIARPLTATSTASVSFNNAGSPCRRRAVRH